MSTPSPEISAGSTTGSDARPPGRKKLELRERVPDHQFCDPVVSPGADDDPWPVRDGAEPIEDAVFDDA